MNVYPTTRVDRDLLLAGADLEAVLAAREEERLERDERTQVRLSASIIARLGYQVPAPGESRDVESRFVSA